MKLHALPNQAALHPPTKRKNEIQKQKCQKAVQVLSLFDNEKQ